MSISLDRIVVWYSQSNYTEMVQKKPRRMHYNVFAFSFVTVTKFQGFESEFSWNGTQLLR